MKTKLKLPILIFALATANAYATGPKIPANGGDTLKSLFGIGKKAAASKEFTEETSPFLRSMISSNQRRYGHTHFSSVNASGKIGTAYEPSSIPGRGSLKHVNEMSDADPHLMHFEVNAPLNAKVDVDAGYRGRSQAAHMDGKMSVGPDDRVSVAPFDYESVKSGYKYEHRNNYAVEKIGEVDTRVTIEAQLEGYINGSKQHATNGARGPDLQYDEHFTLKGILNRETPTSEFNRIRICHTSRKQSVSSPVCGDFVAPESFKGQNIVDYKFYDDPHHDIQGVTVVTADGKARLYVIEQKGNGLSFRDAEVAHVVDRSQFAARKIALQGRVAIQQAKGVKGIAVEAAGGGAASASSAK